MKLYLSSYSIGDTPNKLIALIGDRSKRIAIIDNARDFRSESEKAKLVEKDIRELSAVGLQPERLDLRTYFDSGRNLVADLAEYGTLWITGGNAFLLRKAMEQSGFHSVIEELILTDKIIYAGYSAALSVIGPSLDGAQLVDDVHVQADHYKPGVIWEGYGLIDFYPIVHYKSDHPESASVDDELEYVKVSGRAYKTLGDGDVVIVDA